MSTAAEPAGAAPVATSTATTAMPLKQKQNSDKRGHKCWDKTVLRILLVAVIVVPLAFWGLFFLVPTARLIWLGINGGTMPGASFFGQA